MLLTRRTLPLRNVRYHARPQLPVMLGVALATAVLTGSLVVGDSLRGSLRERALRRLGGVEASYAGTQFVSQLTSYSQLEQLIGIRQNTTAVPATDPAAVPATTKPPSKGV